MIRKVICLLLSLVLVLGLTVPGTLATSLDSDSSVTTMNVEASVETPDQNTVLTDEDASADIGDTAQLPADSADQQPGADTPEAESDAPAVDPQPSGEPAPAEEGEVTDPVTPPVAPEGAQEEAQPPVPGEEVKEPEVTHLETCTAECPVTGCQCTCHTIVDRFLACVTTEEMDIILASMTEEQIVSLTEEEVAAVDAHYASLESAPAPAVVEGIISEPPVQSVIVYETVNFDNVAKFVG